MKKLLIALIPLLFLNYKSISQYVTLDSVTATMVIKDLEIKDFLEKENTLLRIEISSLEEEIEASKKLEKKLRDIINVQEDIISVSDESRREIEKRLYKVEKLAKRRKQNNKIITGISTGAVILLLIFAAK